MVDYVKLKDEEDAPKSRHKRTKKKLNIKGILLLILFIFILSSIISSIMYSFTPKISVVPISGAISTISQNSIYQDMQSSRDIANNIRKAQEDSSIKAVLVDINSPGGSPVASEEISRAIEDVKKVKPVYCLINDMGASGAFWIAMSCDKIYASSMSTLGSIGVTSAGLGFEDFIKEYNVTYRSYTSGKYKDMGSVFREPTQREEEMMQSLLDQIHNKFVDHIVQSRNLSEKQVSEYATGEVFLGDEAKEVGFIDEIGYYPDVVEELRNKTNKNAMIIKYESKPSLAQMLGVEGIFSIPKMQSLLMLN